ncbi:hypothetical protein QPI28_004611 [Vibrio parahaemolyticus]|uniref:hypothetical protein n=1 Tax=Vibrio TaxID=662 RepID=UPI0004F2ABD0|nr:MULTISPECIES: hypothetical protein [Vibrio]EGR3203618.1 hypothetical protein [Vibrio parahaemolyticus]EHG1305267.1 hypothetical protein [Vibrio parahaemolyticus]EIA1343719.1 hypothetical protein [Vibrio parahaemolyticus]EIC5077177.1 hypothetical protein [Vibrio parahaemolyticus]EJG0697397.1 hypothetical protein [Vibrio parahaemolyticus]
MNNKNARLELLHIQLELNNQRTQHMRHFIDQYYCYKNNYVTSTGKASWEKILWNGYVSKAAMMEKDRNKVTKEHIIPLKVIVQELKQLAIDAEVSLDTIRKCIDDNLFFATITKEEDARLRALKVNSSMPKGYYLPGDAMYKDKFCRYKLAKIELLERT